MKLLISQLKEGENPFQFHSQKDAWLKNLQAQVEKAGTRISGDWQIELTINKHEPDYYLRGQMAVPVELVCARCAEAFSQVIQHPFQLALAHVRSGTAKQAESSEEGEELDINYFDENEINLGPILSEQFFLSLPYVALCRPDCLGVCQSCGKNRNSGECRCAASPVGGPFSVLKQLQA